ncbi:hypothetical protein QU39_00335, partial [Staphylococcus aureus]
RVAQRIVDQRAEQLLDACAVPFHDHRIFGKRARLQPHALRLGALAIGIDGVVDQRARIDRSEGDGQAAEIGERNGVQVFGHVDQPAGILLDRADQLGRKRRLHFAQLDEMLAHILGRALQFARDRDEPGTARGLQPAELAGDTAQIAHRRHDFGRA